MFVKHMIVLTKDQLEWADCQYDTPNCVQFWGKEARLHVGIHEIEDSIEGIRSQLHKIVDDLCDASRSL